MLIRFHRFKDDQGWTATNEYRLFRQIADALSRQEIAVLRMDDRGCGCSGGGPFKSATTVERADDIRAGIAFLKDRVEINSGRIGLIGLSEGAIIAPMVAVKDSSIVSMNEWQGFFIGYDPLPTAETVRCLVIILQGDQDELVPFEHANLLAEAIRSSGNQDVTVKIFQGCNHGFINLEEVNKKEKAGKPISEILIISPEVINFILGWIVAKLNL